MRSFTNVYGMQALIIKDLQDMLSDVNNITVTVLRVHSYKFAHSSTHLRAQWKILAWIYMLCSVQVTAVTSEALKDPEFVSENMERPKWCVVKCRIITAYGRLVYVLF